MASLCAQTFLSAYALQAERAFAKASKDLARCGPVSAVKTALADWEALLALVSAPGTRLDIESFIRRARVAEPGVSSERLLAALAQPDACTCWPEDVRRRLHDALQASVAAAHARIVALQLAEWQRLLCDVLDRPFTLGLQPLLMDWLSHRAPPTALIEQLTPNAPDLRQAMLAAALDVYAHGGEVALKTCALSMLGQDLKAEVADGLCEVRSHAPLVFLSQLLAAATWALRSVEGFRFVVAGTLTLDVDMPRYLYGGKHVFIVCAELHVPRAITIDVSAAAGETPQAPQAPAGRSHTINHPTPEQEKNPALYQKIKTAAPGHAGEAGTDATRAGDVFIACGRQFGSGQLSICCNGGNGGNGQQGGDSAPDPGGDPGQPASEHTEPVSIHIGGHFEEAGRRFAGMPLEIMWLPGAPGGPGAHGGDGGRGGNAGRGSAAGSIVLRGAAQALCVAQDGQHGSPGAGGHGGPAGKPGVGGQHGLKLTYVPIGPDPFMPPHGFGRFSAWPYEVLLLGDRVIEPDDAHVPGTPQERFSAMWKQVLQHKGSIQPEHRDQFRDDGHAAEGMPGAEGMDGSSGVVGPDDHAVEAPPLLRHDKPMDRVRSTVDCLLGAFRSDADACFLLDTSGLLAPQTLDSALAVALFDAVEARERPIDTEAAERAHAQVARRVYERLLQSLRDGPAGATPDGAMVAFLLGQKLQSLLALLAGGGLHGNRIVNLEALVEHIRGLVDSLRRNAAEDHGRRLFDEFRKTLDDAVHAGYRQVGELRARIDAASTDSAHEIGRLVDDITRMAADESRYQQALGSQREALRAEMQRQLLFGVLSTVASVVGTVLGTGSLLTDLTQTMQQAGGRAVQAEIDVAQLRAKIEHDDAFASAQASLKRSLEPILNLPGIVPPQAVLEALHRVDPQAMAARLETTGAQIVERFDRLKALEIDRQRLRNDALAPQPADPELYEQESAAAKEQFEGQRGARLQALDRDMQKLLAEDPEMPLAWYALKREQLSELQRVDAVRFDRDRAQALDAYGQALREQESTLRNRRITAALGKALSVGQSVCQGVMRFVDTQNQYEAKMAEVNRAIDASREKVQVLRQTNEQVRTYQQTRLGVELQKLLAATQAGLQAHDAFSNVVAALDVKSFLEERIREIRGAYGEFRSSAQVIDTLQRMEDTMAAQIEIFDRITGFDAQLRMGRLMYGLTAEGGGISQARCDQAKVLQLQKLNRLQRNAYLLLAFPFGWRALGEAQAAVRSGDSLEQALQKAESLNSAIDAWLSADHYSLADEDHSIVYRNFIDEDAYGRFELAAGSVELRRFLTGEPIRLQLPPLADFDAVKYITFYAELPSQERLPPGARRDAARKAMIELRIEGPASFLIEPPDGGAPSLYRFDEDPVRISHSLALLVDASRDGLHVVSALAEDKTLMKFKHNRLESGRSPFGSVTLRLSARRVFDPLQVSERLRQRFEAAFPAMRFSAQMAEALRSDARAAGWLLEHDRIAGWTAMQDTPLAAGAYTQAQEDWLRDALIEQAAPFEPTDLDPLVIRFVGHGKFVHRDDEAPLPVAPEYERFKVV